VTEAAQTSDLQLNSLCNRLSVPAGNQAQLLYLLTELSPGPEMAKIKLPLNVAIVIDRSEPAANDFLPALKQALKDLIDHLQAGDAFSLVAMNGEVLIPAQVIEDKTKLRRQVDRIRTADQKRLAAGLVEGLNQLLPWHKAERVSRLILLIGGDMDEALGGFQTAAGQAGEKGIPLIGLGFGLHWQENYLVDFVNRNQQAQPDSQLGYVDFIASPEDLWETFLRLRQSLHVVAQKGRLNMRLMRGVQVNHAWRVSPVVQDLGEKVIHDQTVTIAIGDLEKDGAAFLVEVAAPPRASGPVRIAQTEASFALPGAGELNLAAELVVGFAQDLGITNPLDSYVMDFVEMAQVCRLTSQAMNDLDQGNRQEAAKNLRQAAAILTSQGQIDLADRIRGEVDYNLRQYGRISGEGRKLIQITSCIIRKVTDEGN
jgi:Ca-activated chloride channel family protein